MVEHSSGAALAAACAALAALVIGPATGSAAEPVLGPAGAAVGAIELCASGRPVPASPVRGAWGWEPFGGAGTAAHSSPAPEPDPPEYYAFPLVATERVPAARGAEGSGEVTFARSPFGVAVAADGSFVYDLRLSISGLREPPRGSFVVWVTTRDLTSVRRIGPVGEDGSVRGRVGWNKFLVVVTLEDSDDPDAGRWTGPIALRGMSRSGRMHTMAGHGPFQQENCATYGFED